MLRLLWLLLSKRLQVGVLLVVKPAARVRAVQLSLRAAQLPALIDQVQVLIAALVVQSGRSAIVAVLPVGPLEVLLRRALRQRLHRALERMGDSLMAQMLRDGVVLLDELVNGHEAAADSNDEIAVFDFHDDLLREVTVVPSLLALVLAHEKAFHALVRVTLVNKIG